MDKGIFIDDDGIPCIILEDEFFDMTEEFKFSVLMSKKNENLKSVLSDLTEFISNNKNFKFFDL